MHLNYTLYTNTQVARILNRPDVLPHETITQNNANIPSFSHHTEKTGYTNELLKKGGLVPVSLVLYKMGLELIDLKHPEQHQTEPELTLEKLRSVRQITRQLEENKLTHWHQIVHSDTQQVCWGPSESVRLPAARAVVEPSGTFFGGIPSWSIGTMFLPVLAK